MGVTFKDIAERAGVSYSTVSRVINDHPTVSANAVADVRRVMKELGYCPPPPERRRGPMRGTPRKDLTGAFALLFPDADERAVRTPLSAALTHGIEDYLYEQRRSLMVTHLREGDRLPVCLERHQVDGVVIRGGELSPALVNRLRSYPTVWIFQATRRIDWADQVFPDNEAIGELAFDYLRKQGATRLLACNVVQDHASFRCRARAFATAAREDGMEVSEEGALVSILQNLRGRVRTGVPPPGVFFPGYEGSVETLCRELMNAGVEIGSDVHLIVCVNDVARVRALVPGLPNIDIQPEAVGRTAAERLLWRLDNPREPIQRLLIAPQLDWPRSEPATP